MSDIALVFNAASLSFDYALSGGDLALDDGLDTAVALSLCTDRLAADDDDIPDGTDDRRGWWGDLPSDGTTPEAQAPDLIGSRLWLLSREKRTQQTLNRAQGYGLEALQWLLDDGVAQTVTFAPQYQGDPSLGLMAVAGSIARLGANGGTVDHRFDLVWSATFANAAAGPAGAVIIITGAPLTDDDGNPLTDDQGNPLTDDGAPPAFRQLTDDAGDQLTDDAGNPLTDDAG